MSVTAAATYANTVMRYFNPSRSPFYAVIAIGTFSLAYAYESGMQQYQWYAVATFIMTILGIGTVFSLTDKSTMSKTEYMDQLFFSRSLCVSAVLPTLAYFGSKHNNDNIIFFYMFAISAIQACTFIVYIWAKKDSPKEISDTNYVQLGLITTTLFLGTISMLKSCSYTVTGDKEIDIISTVKKNFPALYLCFLWGLCIRVWWKLICKLVIIFERRNSK